MRRFAVVLMVLASFGLVIPAGATTPRTSISGTQQVVGVLDPGQVWQSGPIEHGRGRVLVVIQTPDPGTGLPVATTRATVNFNIDTRTFEGRAWGEGIVDYGDGGFQTTFQGSIGPAEVPGGILGEFQVVGHGFGSFEGMQLRATVREYTLLGFATFEGVTFTPGDS